MVSPEEGDQYVRKSVTTIAKTLTELREKGLLPQTSPLDCKIHKVKPGDWVLIKAWKDHSLTPDWEGPFQVLLTTETAIRTEEKGWTHASPVKGPVEEPVTRTRTSPDDPLKDGPGRVRGLSPPPRGVTVLPTPGRLVPAVSTAEPLRSSQVEEDRLPREPTFSQYETCKIRTIKSGTLEKLVVNLLTAFGDNDFTYISIFLSTYRAFASAKEVLEILLDSTQLKTRMRRVLFPMPPRKERRLRSLLAKKQHH
ncbi:uncharacterized protein LOC136009898 [Lathamus discolor]|uniref:uncharacterized protein LOC136009898 n=1 Tax=Lathamus discolor TaxID=678569 RepID=UPI0032B82DAC